MITTERVATVIGALVAVLVQVLVAPHIAVGFAVPNFMAAFALVVAVARSESAGLALPFIVGLAYDLVSGGPVGAMAFAVTAVSSATAWAHRRAGNDTLFMALFVLVVGVLAVEVAYGAFILMLGYSASLLEALAYRVVPCFVYDAIIAVVLYLVLARLMRPEVPFTSEIRQLQ